MKYLSFKPLENESSNQNSVISDAIDLSQIFKISAQIVVSAGTVDGTVQLQVSNDEIKVGYLMLESPTNWNNLGSAVVLSTSGSTLIAQQDVCYRALRAVYSNTNVLVNDITTIADSSSSLNSTYFLLDASGGNYYVWFDVGNTGVNPAVPGRTGVEVDISANDSANAVATAARAAITSAVTSVTVSGATNHIITTDDVAGSFAPAVDGTAATGFGFSNNANTATMSINLMALAL